MEMADEKKTDDAATNASKSKQHQKQQEQQKPPYHKETMKLVRKREKQLKAIPIDNVVEILKVAMDMSPDIFIPKTTQGNPDKVAWLLFHHLRIATNQTTDSSTRSKALQVAKQLTKKIDTAVDKLKNDKEEEETKRKANEQQQQQQQQQQKNGTNVPKPGGSVVNAAAASTTPPPLSTTAAAVPESELKTAFDPVNPGQHYTRQAYDSIAKAQKEMVTVRAAWENKKRNKRTFQAVDKSIALPTEKSVPNPLVPPQQRPSLTVVTQSKQQSNAKPINVGEETASTVLSAKVAPTNKRSHTQSLSGNQLNQSTQQQQHHHHHQQQQQQQQQQQTEPIQQLQKKQKMNPPVTNDGTKKTFSLTNHCQKNGVWSKDDSKNNNNNNNNNNNIQKNISKVAENARASAPAPAPARAPPPYQAVSKNVIMTPAKKNSANNPAKASAPSTGRAYQLNPSDPGANCNASAGQSGKNRESVQKEQTAAIEAKRKKDLLDAKIKRKQQREKEAIAKVLQVANSPSLPAPHREKLITFPNDDAVPRKSGNIATRTEVSVYYQPRPLNFQQAGNLVRRLTEWDPNWRVCRYLACGVTVTGRPTVPLVLKTDAKTLPIQTSLAWCPFKLEESDLQGTKATDWGIQPARTEYMDGQKRLILRMLPVTANTKKRADYHLWPKGSFVVVNGIARFVTQRKQQSHDRLKWLGLSEQLDLTPLIKTPKEENVVKVLTYDDAQYYYCIALCSYVPPATLYKSLTNTDPRNDFALEHLSREESTVKALTFTKPAEAIIDSDDDEPAAAGKDDGGKFIFTLTCPFSMSKMEKPVRGRNCKHFQVRPFFAIVVVFYVLSAVCLRYSSSFCSALI